MSKTLYPVSNNLSVHPDAASIKIARNCHCIICEDCPGLRPAEGVELFRDDDTTERENALINDLVGYGSDDEDSGDSGLAYINTCRCGHGMKEHGADASVLGEEEFARRAALAVRIDERLEHTGHVFDFDYRDEDVDALRQLMKPSTNMASPLTEAGASPANVLPQEKLPLSSPSSLASDSHQAQPPPPKRRRISESSLSDADDDDEEDQPLAARLNASNAHSTMNRAAAENGRTPNHAGGRRGGKSSGKSKAHTAPISIPPPTGQLQAEMNGEAQPRNGRNLTIKIEDKLDEGQLDRLATGVTVDTVTSAIRDGPAIKPEKMSAVELRKGVIKIIPVENDNEPRSLVILTNLKTLFQKQLPVMPREYIARLVYDPNQKCLAICKRGYKVVGGICYRPFPHRGFAEIVFFATASVDQEKGYGGMLMDHFKAHIKRTYPDMKHFLTYADNYAVGYFRKQGFSKEITLDRAKWAGYIKDYEGGTIMQCTMLDKVDYLNVRKIVEQQMEAVSSKMAQLSKSHIVYPGLTFEEKEGEEGERKVVPLDPKNIPGLRESGWEPPDVPYQPPPTPEELRKSTMLRILKELKEDDDAWPFVKPVTAVEAPDYYDVILHPMDLGTMEKRAEAKKYLDYDSFLADAQLIWDNCRTYNSEQSVFWKNANKLEKRLKDIVARLRL